MGIQIISTGSYLPPLTVTNDDLSKFLDTSDEWITTRTGIHTRHIAVNETTSDMGTQAAKTALERSGLDADDIDLVICATVSPDVCVPMVASNIKKALNIEHCVGFDMNANCSSFVYALTTAASLMEYCGYRNAIVVGTDTNSQILNWQDRSTCVLWGDGAGAVVLSRTDKKGILATFMDGMIDKDGALVCRNKRDVTPFHPNYYDEQGKVIMNGHGTMKFAVNAFSDAVHSVLKKANITADDIKLIIPHQANIRIIKSAAKRMGIGEDKFFINIDRNANTSCASIPIALDEALQSRKFGEGDLVLLTAFGGGLSSGAVLLEW